jgi:hypothetical protein
MILIKTVVILYFISIYFESEEAELAPFEDA